jgi:hypothetical protein
MTTPQPTASQSELVGLVDAYCRRICPAVLDQHPGNSVSSALGIWLLLAATATAASGPELAALEEALGCPAAQAAELLARFLDAPPAALRTAIALWVRGADHTTPLVEWSASLPSAVERGPVPSQSDADAWTDRKSGGLIKRFPLELSPRERLVLASLLATKVSWASPLRVVPASGYLRASSPWRDLVAQVLLDELPSTLTMLASTEAAGVVAVHFAQAVEHLGVLCVAADPSVDRRLVFEAGYELARRCRNDTLGRARCSLFDLPVGEGHSWDITEREVRAYTSGESFEEIEHAVLAEWRSECNLDLAASARFGGGTALLALFGLIGPSPDGDGADAIQSVLASYTSTGFEAVDASFLRMRAGAIEQPTHPGLERRAKLYFDHPYIAIALAGRSSDFSRTRAGHTDLFCLPMFSAWIETPGDAEMTSLD